VPNAPSDVENANHFASDADSDARPRATPVASKPAPAPMAPEIGGPSGPEPTRFGDWEKHGRCIDF